MDRLTVIVNSEKLDMSALQQRWPSAVTVGLGRDGLPVADGAAQLLIAALPDERQTPPAAAVAELLRPVAVSGLLTVCGPPAALAEAAASVPEAVADGEAQVAVALADVPSAPGSEWLVLRRTGMQHTGSAGCIICGRSNTVGLGWRYWQSGHRAWASGAIPAHLQGFEGVVHGGIVAAVLDDALWYAIHAATGEITLTAELTMRYRHPVPIGVPLTAAAQFTGRQRRILSAEARLWGPDGKVLATASGRFMPGPDEFASRIG